MSRIFIFIVLSACLITSSFAQEAVLESTALEDLDSGIACYFEAVVAQDSDALSACFGEDPVIIDVSRDIAGLETIKAWAEREVFGGVYTLHEVYLEEDSTRILLSFAPTGVGGFRAWYTITQQGDGLIQVMDLQYAR